ncbi:MAG: hypothetical protein HXX17_04110 [Geobacteraceae bacterium]|nr:hypothetical protein [Geobacteraceae bacterium]
MKLSSTDLLAPGFVAGKTVKTGAIQEHYSSAHIQPPVIPVPPPSQLTKQAQPKTAYGAPRLFSSFSVDTLGRLTKQATMGAYSTQYTYVDNSAKVASVLDSNYGKVNFNYNEIGRISSYGQGNALVTVIYNTSGRVETYKNFKITYDNNNNPVAFTDGIDSARIARTYDNFGNETRADYFFKSGTDAETALYSIVSSYGQGGVESSTLTLLDLSLQGNTPYTSITTTTSYKGMEVVKRVWDYKDSSGTIIHTQNIAYSGQTYDAGNLITYIENDIVPGISSYFYWWRQYWVTLVSGKDNQ